MTVFLLGAAVFFEQRRNCVLRALFPSPGGVDLRALRFPGCEVRQLRVLRCLRACEMERVTRAGRVGRLIFHAG